MPVRLPLLLAAHDAGGAENVAAWARPGIGVINKNEMPQVYEWNLEVGMRYIF